ncbi:hypothetical protein F5X68DRAFT_265065 [Plectosphaerella plurivora]|uniref:Uncharacterized protein n=1 Tax=Plectosphaerella plurivora TaxID=936078 RepID=A0A9P8V3L7_9PEZI|nr:hypothetical protein F5X68DRAFT_265065 [Plectosphaerella plurivora]
MPVVSGRERNNSSANKRGPPSQSPTSDGAQAPKRRPSTTSDTIHPSIETDDMDQDMSPAQASQSALQGTTQETTTNAQYIASDDEDDDDDLFADKQLADALPDVDALLGDVPEKKVRSYKEVVDNLTMLIRQRDEKREEARQIGEKMDIKNWLLAGNHLRHIYRGADPLSPVESAVNEIVEISKAAERLSALIQGEQEELHSRDFTAPGKALPLSSERGVYEEGYTLVEALRRSTPLVSTTSVRGNTVWKEPAPVVTGTRVNRLVEGGPGWNTEWRTLDHPQLNLDAAIIKLREARDRSNAVNATTPASVRESVRRALKHTQSTLHMILMIRQYFANGYTFHPNQLVGPEQLPPNGFCTRALLYMLALCFRRLIAIRDKDTTTGLNMSPIDFLRWRLAVHCQGHDHARQGKRGSIANCLRFIYREVSEKPHQCGDQLLRSVMIHASRIEGQSGVWSAARRCRERRSGQQRALPAAEEDVGDEEESAEEEGEEEESADGADEDSDMADR